MFVFWIEEWGIAEMFNMFEVLCLLSEIDYADS